MHVIQAGTQRVLVVQVIVEPGRDRYPGQAAGNQAEEARDQRVNGVALGRGRWRAAAEEHLIDRIDDAGLDVAVDDRVIAASEVAVEEIEQLILDECAAEGEAACRRHSSGLMLA